MVDVSLLDFFLAVPALDLTKLGILALRPQ